MKPKVYPGLFKIWDPVLNLVLGLVGTHRDDKVSLSMGKMDKQMNAFSSAWKNVPLRGQGRNQ